TVAAHHDRGHGLAPLRVGPADHRDLGDLGVPVEHLLDLGGVHVLPARDDHVFLAVDDPVIALVVTGGQIAGEEPTADNRLGGGGGAVPVADEHVRPADRQLPDLTGGHGRSPIVDHTQVDVHHRFADR